MFIVPLQSQSEFWPNFGLQMFWGSSEPDARPSHGWCMGYGAEFLGFLLRCLRNSMFAPLTRAPHLLLRTFTGCSSVRLFRFHVSWSTHGWPGGILAENLSISKDGAKVRRTFALLQIFGQENAKKVHFGGFWGQKWWFTGMIMQGCWAWRKENGDYGCCERDDGG